MGHDCVYDDYDMDDYYDDDFYDYDFYLTIREWNKNFLENKEKCIELLNN